MRPVEFERRICTALREAIKLSAGNALVLAISGGPDSIALLRAVYERNTRDEFGWRLHIAHLNHGLRGVDSTRDAEFVREIAVKLRLGVTIGDARLDSSAPSLEERARRARYRFLERVAGTVGATAIAVAHHADDQAETVLHHVLRGTGPRGLAGMRPVRSLRRGGNVLLVRPMLAMTRSDVMAYLKSKNQPHREDRTNRNLDRTRNRLRHRVLPLVECEVNHHARAALVRLAKSSQSTQAFIDETAEHALSAALRRSSRRACELDAVCFAGLSHAIQVQVILKALERLNAPLGKVQFEHLQAAAGLAAPTRNGKRIELPGRIVVRRTRRALTIERAASGAELIQAHD